MKKFLPVLLYLCIFLLLAGCANSSAGKPDTNLEFWIADNVTNFDFSGYQEKYGLFGGREYYGSGYTPLTDADGQQQDPEHCVIYTVTAYPDYSSRKSHITGIYITDPAVKVFGLSRNSTQEEIKTTMQDNGFRLQTNENAYGLSFQKGKITVHFCEESISLRAKVRNFWGIQF